MIQWARQLPATITRMLEQLKSVSVEQQQFSAQQVIVSRQPTIGSSAMRTITTLIVVLVALLNWAPAAIATEKQGAKLNRLANEDSPYLRQHASNPVDWYPWGKEAFEKARKENKPILLSVGYSTCHWCHVMERESFSNKEIADVLNKHFVSIKVDRERRPEIDETYMLATEILNQSGGWPNNVFLTPDLKPFAAVTYLSRPDFKDLMQEITVHWTTNPGPVMGQAERVGNVIALYMQSQTEAQKVTPQLLKSLVKQATVHFDESNGGMGVAPKFPQESLLLFLLEQAERNLNDRAREVALKTLDAVIRGGIRDHIGGGFHRYAVDPAWRVPHFEKMLYNQALVGQALVQAYRMTGAKRYESALRETLDYTIRDMQLPSGGFATASDAESKTSTGEKKEGAFFVWKPSELSKILSKEDATFASAALGITEKGNFHGTSIPHLPAPLSAVADKNATGASDVREKLTRIKQQLNAARNKRAAPLRDDKVLTSWNAMLIRTLADAAIILNDKRYVEAAGKAAEFIWTAHRTAEGDLKRFSFEGKTSALNGTQPDYAYLAMSYVALFDATGDVNWLNRAVKLVADMNRLFADRDAGDYIMARTNDPIPPAKIRSDQPVPSGNSVALELLSKLSRRTLTVEYRQQANRLLASLSGGAARTPVSSGYTLKSADEFLRGELGTVQFLGKGQVRVALDQSNPDQPKLDVRIAPGWHINAEKPLEDAYIATKVSAQGKGDPKLSAIGYPQPIVRKLGFASGDMALYEGGFTIPLTLDSSDPRPRTIQFTAQACSDKICLEPETLNMTLMPKAP